LWLGKVMFQKLAGAKLQNVISNRATDPGKKALVMKTLFLALIFTLLSLTSTAQSKVMTFQQAEKSGIEIKKLNSIYPSGLNADSAKSVFTDKRDEYSNASEKISKDLKEYMTENKFTGDKPTVCFIRIYFNQNGQIDYLLYSFSKGEIGLEKEKQFDILLNKFFTNYTFPLKTKTGFSQGIVMRHID
jgi:hypothetical protein